MKKWSALLLFSVLQVSIYAGDYKPLKEGKWPFRASGVSFSPYITDNWLYATKDISPGYVIYFYREGSDSVKYSEEGGIQLNSITQTFAGAEQLITYLRATENVYSDPSLSVKYDDMNADSKYGRICVRYSRVFEVKEVGNTKDPVYIRDEGYYFVHPSNSKLIVRVHLFRRSVDALSQTGMGAYVESFYRNFSVDSNFTPAWTIGAVFYIGFGNTDGLYFGYNDSETGEKITADPGAATGLHLTVYRRIKGVWIGGGEVGFSSSTALSGIYTNLDAMMKRGAVVELGAGALLFSRLRHRLQLTGGPVFYSSPKLELNIQDPAGNEKDIFNYKPAVGFNTNINYILVSKRRLGQFVFGVKVHFINLKLRDFTINGVKFDESALGATPYNHFRNVNATNTGIVMFGYQYTF